jgi:hypothetical protein
VLVDAVVLEVVVTVEVSVAVTVWLVVDEAVDVVRPSQMLSQFSYAFLTWSVEAVLKVES